MTLLAPQDAAELSALPADVRAEVRAWVARLETVSPPVTAALKRIASTTGVSFATARRKYDAFRADGWRGLVNRAKCRDGEASLHPDTIEHWQRLCVENQRKCRPAYRKLVRDFHAGAPIPGVAEGTPRHELPAGWSYENLMRHKPTAFQMKAVRIGRVSASDLGPMVYTTRRGMRVGEFFVFDDIVHDHFVNVLDTRQAGRPVEFHALDLRSACKVHWGISARTENQITGKMMSLREEYMRFLLASLLSSYGYRPDVGSTMVVENGTAAIREDLERILHDLTGGLIKVSRSGIQGDRAFIGQFGAAGGGNFRFKAALESLGNLVHNEMADTLLLPGQTGRNKDARPEETDALLNHNRDLLHAITALAESRPDVVQALRMPVVSLDRFRSIADAIYSRINGRTDHRLEGWDELCVPADGGRTVRRLSPAEVWQQGRRELTPMLPEAIAQVLYRDCANEMRVTDRREIEVWDKSLSADVIRFDAHGIDPGEKFQAVLNPFAPDSLFLFDARGRYVGSIPRIRPAARNDQDAVERAMGRARSQVSELLGPVARLGKRITEQRLEEARANATALRQLETPESRLAARAAVAGAAMAATRTTQPAEVLVPDETISVPDPDAPLGDVDEVI